MITFNQVLRIAPFALLALISGMFDGLNQTLLFHYGQFVEFFPSANPQYWNPDLSWTNKGSNIITRTVLVFTTDAYHLTRTITWVSLLCAVYGLASFRIIESVPRWLYFIIAFAFVYCWKGLGFHLVYSLLFR